MKPAPFRYFAPATLPEALAILAEEGDQAKLLAGGQSLIPTMNFRLAQPAVLIDLNRISTLASIQEGEKGGLRIGAMTRQRTVERSELVKERTPLLHAAMPHIAHVQIRNRGTIGGSLAHADPAAELPAVMCALDARFCLQNQKNSRWLAASDFFVALFTTALAADEILTEIEIPATPARSGWSIQEVVRRTGDYAIVGLAARVTLDEAGCCQDARLVYLSVGEGPVQAQQATALLRGQQPSVALINEAAEVAGEADIDPLADIHASVAYRRHLAKVLARRALHEAFTCANPRG